MVGVIWANAQNSSSIIKKKISGFSFNLLIFCTKNFSRVYFYSLNKFVSLPFSIFPSIFCLCRVVWSLFCCPSCVWCWSCTLVDAGANVAVYLSRKRALVLKQPMRSTTSPLCWWVDRLGKVWEILADRDTTRAAPSASVRLRSWMGTSMTSQTYATTCSESAWTAVRTSPVRWHVRLTHFKGAMTKLAWISLQVCEPIAHCTA